MTPKVSILIPVYNREEFLSECITSAICQTFYEIEVIIVDNCSTDNSWKICNYFAKLDTRIRIFRNSFNIGPVLNWRRCAELARGEFCKILFSDDVLSTNCVEILFKLLKNDVSFSYGAARIGSTPRDSVLNYAAPQHPYMSSDQFLLLVLEGLAPVSPGAALLRRKDLIENLKTNFPTLSRHDFKSHGAGPDVMLLLSTSECYPSIAHTTEPIVFFRAHSGSLTVEDNLSEITRSYRAIFAYYLRKKNLLGYWRVYVLLNWLRDIKKCREWTNPKVRLKEFGGNGSNREVFLAIFGAIKWILSNQLKRKICIFKQSQTEGPG